VIIEQATVLSNEPAYKGAYVMWFHAPGLARDTEPGQFVMVHCSVEGTDPMFARAFSYHRIEQDRFAILYNVVGRGTDWLATRKTGDLVRVYGPLGRGFRLPEGSGNLLLVGGGVGIAPMVDMAERAVAAGHHVVAMMGARSERYLLPASAWPKETEYVVVT
jgi:dihydroorotate dehydrogenase electron transfer subunit